MSLLARLTAPLVGAVLVILASPVVTCAQPAGAPHAVAPPAPTVHEAAGAVIAPMGPVTAPAAAAASVPAARASAPTAVSVPAPAFLAQATTPPPPPAAPPAEAPSDQDTRTPPPPPPAAPPASAAPAVRAARARPAIAAESPRAERDRSYVSKGVNIRIDATVTEQRADQVLGKKVVTVTVVDGQSGLVRSTQQVPYRVKGTNGFNYQSAPLNMDARAILREDGRVLVSLTLDYRAGPSEAGTEADTMDQGIRQSVTVVLDSGKPLVVAQSADAVGDRRVMLELKATTLK